MKVKNVGRIMFPKGLELERDIFPGQSAAVLMGCEQNQRLQNALACKNLEVVIETPVEPSKEYKGAVKMYRALDGSSVAAMDSDPNIDLGKPASGPGFINEQFQPPLPVKEEKVDEFAEFFRRKGVSRLRYIEEMTDIKALRQVLLAARGSKSKAALAARITQLSHVPNSGEQGL